ncbi:hypothetical protein M0813_28576 [Anaeramoeba flamelloides]|uniref:BTB domain-containing protein n=1 Tax=Anaeramoeba flamelloides TaxID=1746091 RepID=A0ABQ8XVA3_9EUKA|nr:hypothetical protein M0813_28576 [Anaeramoeba flamelloides]
MSKVKVFQKQLNPFSRKWKKIFDKRIEKISYGCSNGNILVWKKKNILDIYQKENLYKSAHENSTPESGSESDDYYPDEYKEKNVILDEDEDEKVQDIKSGQDTSLILTRSGFVYYLQEYYYSSYWKNKGEDSFEILIKEVDGIRSCKSISMNKNSNFYLLQDGSLYKNEYIDTIYYSDWTHNKFNTKNISGPEFVFSNVKKIYTGKYSQHFFFATSNNDLYSCGLNDQGQLAIGNVTKQESPQKVSNWGGNDISDLHCFQKHSILINYEGKIYSCGSGKNNGIGKNKHIFTEIPFFKRKNIKAKKVVGGTDSTLILTNELALYVWGTLSDSKHLKPTEIILPKYFNQYPSEFLTKNLMISYKFSDDTILVYLNNFRRKTFKDDFKRLFQSKKFCDSKLKINRGKNGTKNKKENNLKIEIPIHKLLIELRTDRKINEIQQIIYRENFSKKEIRRFLKWIYYDDQKNQKLLEKIFLSLKMAFPPKNNLKRDLKRLFKEEETKDFMFLFKKRGCGKKKKKIKTQTKKKVTLSNNEKNNEKNNDNDNDNNEDDDDEIYGKIRVHKLILFTRSELFRSMFENLNEEEKKITSIRDYTNKSEESLQLLIKYLYTDKLGLKGKKNINIKAVIEELHDSVDYYQLNIHSNLPNELNNLKNLKVK